jgi:hypothetical protein
VSKVAVLKTRPDKEQVDIVGLLDRWQSEAAVLGWNPERVVAAVQTAADSAQPATPDVELLVLQAVKAAGARKAIFTRSDLAAEVAARIPADAGVNAATLVDCVERLTDRALATSEAVELRPDHDGPVRASDARYASATTVNRELAILRFADAGQHAGVALCRAPVVADACRRHRLDSAQTAAVARIVLCGDQLSVLVAPAGTGKTTTLAAMVDAWRFTGHPVVALAPSVVGSVRRRRTSGTPCPGRCCSRRVGKPLGAGFAVTSPRANRYENNPETVESRRATVRLDSAVSSSTSGCCVRHHLHAAS